MPALPSQRGPISERVLDALLEPPHALEAPAIAATEPLADEDLQLALYCCYELHYRGFDGVEDAWEWEPSLIALRLELEAVFEEALRAAVGDGAHGPVDPARMDVALREIADADGPLALRARRGAARRWSSSASS